MRLKVIMTTLFLITFYYVFNLAMERHERSHLGLYITACNSETQEFAGFGLDPSFINQHVNPEEYSSQLTGGEMITYEVQGGEPANGYYVKSEIETADYLIVVHEWWGLNDHIKGEAERLAKELGNINVLALDLYDGKVASTRENASKYMQSVSADRAEMIIAGARNFVGDDARVFTIGWCFGGGWSLQTAIELENLSEGAVMFYGMPEKDLDRLRRLRCDVLGIFAKNEKWITPQVVAEFEVNMLAVGKNLQVKSYDAAHGFANPSNPRFNAEATEDANNLVLNFIQERR